MFRRGRVFWAQDNETGKQETLRTRERIVAERLLHAKNKEHLSPSSTCRSPAPTSWSAIRSPPSERGRT